MMILGGSEANAKPTTQVFCFERTALPWLGRVGFEEPTYLPTGSNQANFSPSRISAAEKKRLGLPLTFVGNSWWQKARLSFSSLVREEATTLSAKRTVDRAYLQSGFEAELDGLDREARRKRALSTQATLAELAMRSRAEFVSALADQGIVVYGDKYWGELVDGVSLRPPVSFHQELPALFAGTRVNTNVTAEQMPTALNQRVWDVPAVGGFLLTDAQPDLFEFFEEGVDVVSFSSLDEARDKARFYLGNASSREAIAARAHAKVEREHRTHHRLGKIESIMRRRFG